MIEVSCEITEGEMNKLLGNKLLASFPTDNIEGCVLVLKSYIPQNSIDLAIARFLKIFGMFIKSREIKATPIEASDLHPSDGLAFACFDQAKQGKIDGMVYKNAL